MTLRVLHVVVGRPKPEASNGVLKSVYYLTQELSKHRLKVGVLSLGKQRGKNSKTIGGVVTEFGVHRGRFPCLCRHTRQLINNVQDDYDLVHFSSAYHISYYLIARRLKEAGVPWVVSPRGSYQAAANERNRFIKRIYKALFETFMFRNASYVHVLNSNERECAIQYGVSKGKLLVIPNAIDFDSIPPKNQRHDSGTLQLVYCGRLDYYGKGLDVLIEAIALIRERMAISVRLKLIGPGSESDLKKIKVHVYEAGITDLVAYTGALYGEKKYCEYAQADLFILPSRSEGFPISVLEAMAFGTPCLVTPECNIPQDVIDAKGVLLADLTPDSLAEKIKLIFQNRSLLAELSANGIKLSKQFDIKSIASIHLAEYQNVLGDLKL